MAKKKAAKIASEIVKLPIPRGTIGKIKLGQSFAEYDRILTKPNVFVETPAIVAALDTSRSKCFF